MVFGEQLGVRRRADRRTRRGAARAAASARCAQTSRRKWRASSANARRSSCDSRRSVAMRRRASAAASRRCGGAKQPEHARRTTRRRCGSQRPRSPEERSARRRDSPRARAWTAASPRDREPIFLRRGDRLAYAALPLLAGAKLLGVLSVQPGGDARESRRRRRCAARDRRCRSVGCSTASCAPSAPKRAPRAARPSTRRRCACSPRATRIASRRASRPRAALILDAEHVIVRALDPERRSFRVRCHFGADVGSAATTRSHSSIAASRARRCAAARCSAARIWRWTTMTETRRRTLLVAPLAHGGRALGTLAVYDKRAPAGPHFDAVDREVLLRLAAVTARALANALSERIAVRQRRESACCPSRISRGASTKRSRAPPRPPPTPTPSRWSPAASRTGTSCRRSWPRASRGTPRRPSRRSSAASTSPRARRRLRCAPCCRSPARPPPSTSHASRAPSPRRSRRMTTTRNASRSASATRCMPTTEKRASDLLARAAEPRIRML